MTAEALPVSAPIAEGFDSFLNDIRSNVAIPLLVDLGCGKTTLPNDFQGVDLSAADGVLEFDLCSGRAWPFRNESVDAFTSSHFIEHVANWAHHFREVYRCLKPGGLYRFVAPYPKSDRYLQDPTHCQPIHENKLWYLQQTWLRANGIEHYNGPYNFSIEAIGWAYHKDYEARAATAEPGDVSLEYARSHYWNVVDDIYVLVRKEELLP